MTFASPGWLLLLLFGGLIAFLHSRPRRDVDVGSLFLWRQLELAVPPKATRKLPVPNALLFLQLLALLLITLALARPIRTDGEVPVDHWIVLVDVSASMDARGDGQSAFEEARAYLTARLENAARKPGRVSVVRVGSIPEVEVGRMRSVEEVVSGLDQMRLSSAGADWTRAGEVVRGLMFDGESTRVTLLTDAAGSADTDRFAVSGPQVEVERHVLGAPVPNLALMGVEPVLLDPETGLWRVTGAVQWFGPADPGNQVEPPASDRVTVQVLFAPTEASMSPGADVSSGSVASDLPTGADTGASPDIFSAESGENATGSPSGEWTRFEVALGPDGIGTFDQTIALQTAGVLELRLPEDALASDNSVRFVIHERPRVARVLYVGQGDRDLELVLRAIPGVEVTRSAALPSSAADFDLVLLDEADGPTEVGTSVVRFASGTDGMAMDPVGDPTPSRWIDIHPLSASVDWSSLNVFSAQPIALLPGATAVVETRGGHPLVQARTTEAGREVTLAFRLQDTDWPEQLGFPAFISNLVLWAVPDLGLAVMPPCIAGEACSVGPRAHSPGTRLLSPEGEEIPFSVLQGAAGDGADFIPRNTGIYQLISGNGETRAIAVNSPVTGEGDLFGPFASGEVEASSVPVAPAEPLPIHRWLLIAALAVLVGEGWLANRRGERLFRLEGLWGDNPMAPRRRLVLAFRLASLAAVVVAILDPRVPVPNRDIAAVLVIDDHTTHTPEARAAARAFITGAADATGRNRSLGAVRVGSTGEVGTDLGTGRSLGGIVGESALHVGREPEITEPVDRGGGRNDVPGGIPGNSTTASADATAAAPSELAAADLEASLRLAASLLPQTSAGRLTVLGDGTETRGNLARVIPDLIRRGVPVDVVLPSDTGLIDVAVESVTLPRGLHPNEIAQLRTVIGATTPGSVQLRLLRDGEVIEERVVEVDAGRNRVDFEIVEDSTGTFLYEVEVRSPDGIDARPSNDRNGLVVEVRSPPRIAIVTPQLGWGRTFADALALQTLEAEVFAPSAAPGTGDYESSSLADFDALVLMNVPADDLPAGSAEAIEEWVREGRGGLILTGGENTFGPGGYYDSPLEAVSPLSAKIPQELPNLAIVFVLDRSSSMDESVGQGTRLDLAKVATLDAIDLLDPETEVGVVAFDLNAYTVVPVQRAGNREQIREQIERLETGGGTWIYTGLALAFVELSQIDPEWRRHIVLMSDGRSQPANYARLMGLIAGEKITVSTAAIGAGADIRLMEDLARRGSGAAHATTDFTELPSILAREASRFSSNPIREEEIEPVGADSAFAIGNEFEGGPQMISGFVRTTVKPGARVHLEAGEDSPLLASWRYGLGRVVAFASQGAGNWTAEWIESPEYSTWWAQAIRWALPTTSAGLNVQVSRDRDYGRVIAEVSDGLTSDVLALEAMVRAPDGTTHSPVRLAERAPGIYEGTFLTDLPGTYTVALQPTNTIVDEVEPVETSLYVGYSAREAVMEPNTALLRALAEATGGRVLEHGHEVLDFDAPIRWLGRSIWTGLALLAIGVFLLELLGRYTSLFRRLAG